MDCVCLIAKPFSCKNPFERYILKQHEKQITQKKQQFYSKILKFTSSRFPSQFVHELQKQINPFQQSLQQLRVVILDRYPDLPEDVVNQCVQYVFGKKAREAVMIKQSETIIETGDQTIRNNRKLIKQDLSVSLLQLQITDRSSLPPLTTSRLNTTRQNQLNRTERGESTKRSMNQNSIKPYNLEQIRRELQTNPLPQDKGLLSSARRRKLPVSKNELFNQILAQEIQRESSRYRNLQIIYQNDPQDLINKQKITKRTQVTDRLSTKRDQKSLQVIQDIGQVDQEDQAEKADMETLKKFLAKVATKCEDKEQLNNLSQRGMYMTKINSKNMEDLYTAQGTIKMNVVKRTANRLIAEYD